MLGRVYTQTGAAGQFSLDRWNVSGDVTSKFSAQQNAGSATPPTGFSNYLGTTSLSAYSVPSAEDIFLDSILKAITFQILHGVLPALKQLHCLFGFVSSLTGTFGGAIKNSDNSRSYPISYSIAAANTWEYKTITINGDTSGSWATTNSIGISVAFSLGAGSGVSGTANTWTAGSYWSATGATSVVGTSGATFYITGVQLEPGSTATPFERRSYGQELALCQRYYQVFGDLNLTISGRSTNAATTVMPIVFRTTMRTAPTVAGTLTVGSGLSFSSTIDTMRVIGTADGNGTFVVSNSTASAEL
jgi:hypothetical protein